MTNFAQVLEVAGKPVKLPDIEAATLADVLVLALDMPIEKDKNEGLKPKLERGRLIEKIEEAAASMEDLKLKAGEIDKLKERVAQVFSSPKLILYVSRLLDPAEAQVEEPST